MTFGSLYVVSFEMKWCSNAHLVEVSIIYLNDYIA